MSPSIYLSIYNIISIVSIVILLSVVWIVISKDRKKEANITIGIAIFFIAFFFFTHVLGINTSDPKLSRTILSFNVFMIFIGTFNLHAILAFFGKAKEKRLLIYTIHACAVVITALFLLFPDSFLLDSVPKMYFPNYYNPGDWNIIRIIFIFAIVIPICFYELYSIYKKSEDPTRRMQIRYLALSMGFGYLVGFIPNFLVYDVMIDPLWGAPTAVIFSIPFLYALIQYRLFNIRVVAKQALYYSSLVGAIGIAVASINYFVNLIQNLYPDFPIWVIYLISSSLVVVVSAFIWQKLKETEELKYEFITTMTHKLRTPMTGIKWAIENLQSMDLVPEAKKQISYIRSENIKLIELTNIIVGVSKIDNSYNYYEYNIKNADLASITDKTISEMDSELVEKEIDITKQYDVNTMGLFDEDRMRSVIRILLENAIEYSPHKAKINISIIKKNKDLEFCIEDFGVGIKKEDMPKLFNKFYRSEYARTRDTEGLGIGLFVAKDIIYRMNGKIWAQSKGENLGSRFCFTIPRI